MYQNQTYEASALLHHLQCWILQWHDQPGLRTLISYREYRFQDLAEKEDEASLKMKIVSSDVHLCLCIYTDTIKAM